MNKTIYIAVSKEFTKITTTKRHDYLLRTAVYSITNTYKRTLNLTPNANSIIKCFH